MRPRSAARLLVLALTALAACSAGEALYQERLLAMATWVDLVFEARDPAQARDAARDVEKLLSRAEHDLYAWDAHGELARVNRAFARGEPAELSAPLAELLGRARVLSAESGGLFDPGVGALVELWGFNSMSSPPTRPPSDAAISALLAEHATIGELEISGSTATSRSEALVLDLGGIAKGYVVDRALALLAAHGIHDALVDAGGDLRVAGSRGGRPWRIGIKDPRHDGVLAALELEGGEAAFTSGDYERYFESGGRRYHHLLDPTTGRPAEHTASVTVIAADGVTADAAATALFVAGPKRWREVARSLGIEMVLRVDANGSVETTSAMAARLNSSGGAASDIIAAGPRG